jgi:hypothetical protein
MISLQSTSARGSAGLPVAVNAALECASHGLGALLRHCEEAEREHAENRRQYAHTFHFPETICIVEAFWRLPKRHRDGIILHEFGHLVAGPDASESEANEAVERLTGAVVRYVNSRYGAHLESSTDSVEPLLCFDRVAGRGSAGLPVARPNVGGCKC